MTDTTTRLLRRTCALAAVAALAAAGVAAGTTTAGAAGSGDCCVGSTPPPPSTNDRAAGAAGYLARHLEGKNHDHFTVTFGGKTYPDYGTTADAVLSMDAAGVARGYARNATAYLEKHAGAYAVAQPTDYPGAAAKLLLVAVAQHRNVHDFGGVDLVKAVTDSEGAGGAAKGEYQQNPGFSGDSYTVSQALPVLALAVTTDAPGQPDADAVAFLTGQQCADGAFATVIRTDTSTPCADNDVDTTGYAVQALLAAGSKAAAAKGLAWLAHARHTDGGWGTGSSNANSTSLAVQALVAGHESARAGIRWLRRHQLWCGTKVGRAGAVTFESKYDRASAVRATSQAGAALAGKPLAWIDRNGARSAAPVPAC